ncbi:MAG: GNAT family N-acetyltransferase [Spirochaetales bacterium]|jgi:GNAT superfamily N-acetyltransferase|nr:GNAT family N-acetyltransferase [Spirochaetales bacterium]
MKEQSPIDADTHAAYVMPQLSDEFIYQVLFCMEDQAKSYMLDLADRTLIEAEDIPDVCDAEERFLELPDWGPADGFRVMEKFVASLRNPIYRQQLHDALNLGRGVFRQFKNVLKQEPAVERLWYYFKEREIKRIIYKWYEQMSEVLHLKDIGEPEESLEDLILSDFVITYDQNRWRDHIRELGRTKLKAEFSVLGYPVSEILFGEYERAWDAYDDSWLMVFMESPSGDFAGFVGAEPKFADDSVLVYNVKHLYVEPQFRGLGIFKLLADTLCRKAEEEVAERILMELSGKAAVLSHTLTNRGFTLIGQRFALNLAEWEPKDAAKG